MRLTHPFFYNADKVKGTDDLRAGRSGRRLFDQVEVEIREISPAAAPVVLIETYEYFKREARGFVPARMQYRLFEGRLWTDSCTVRRRDGKYTMVKPTILSETMWDSDWNRSRDERIELIENWASARIIIEGQVWQVAGVPLLMVSWGGQYTSISVVNEVNPSVGRDCYYRIDELKRAVSDAKERWAQQQILEPRVKFKVLDKRAISIDLDQVFAEIAEHREMMRRKRESWRYGNQSERASAATAS